MIIKDSSLVKFLKNIMGVYDVRNDLTDDEIIKLDYYECICYLYKGKEKPDVIGFKSDVNMWLITTVGPIELDYFSHNKGHLTNNVYELEALIGENGYDNTYVLKLMKRLMKNGIDNLFHFFVLNFFI